MGLVGGEGLDPRHVDGDLPGGVGLEDQLAAGGANDLAGEAVTGEKDDLVGESGHGKQAQRGGERDPNGPHGLLLASTFTAVEQGGR
jgi:hypothetical protein